MSFLTNELKRIISFSKKPKYEAAEVSGKEKLKTFFITFVINIACTMVVVGLLTLVDKFIFDFSESHIAMEMFENFPLWVVAVLGIIIAPFWEEAAFRLPLKYRKEVVNVLIALVITIAIILQYSGAQHTYSIITSVLLLIVLLLFIFFNRRVTRFTEYLWKNKFPFVFYFFTIAFALIHISNFKISTPVLLLLPVLILPQFVVGFFIGYIRVRLGFFWGVLFHAIHNAIFMLPALIAMESTFNEVKLTNDDYSISIEKSNSANHYFIEYSHFNDSLKIKNHDFKAVIAKLTDKDEKFIEIEKSSLAKTKLDIIYAGKSDLSDSVALNKARKEILSEMKKAYGFKLVTEKRTIPFIEVKVKDSIKLNEYKNKSNIHDASMNMNDAEATFTNTSIDGIAGFLNSEYNEEGYFFAAPENKNRYDIKIEKPSFAALKNYLEKNFGLTLTETKKEAEIIKIVFEK